jgi:hypothetical protein
MAAYKRSDPTKLLKQKQQIVQDMEQRENVPQSDRMFPNIGERIRRGVVNALDPLEKAIGRKQLRKNPPPERRGAKVTGFKEPDTTA